MGSHGPQLLYMGQVMQEHATDAYCINHAENSDPCEQ